MHTIKAKKGGRALLAALALALALPAATFAATTHPVNDSVQVSSSIAIIGAPTTITYAPGLTAGLRQGDAPVTLNVQTNNGSGAKLTVTGTDLTGSGGSIPATARVFTAAWGASGAPASPLLFAQQPTPGAAAGTPLDLAQSAAAGSWDVVVDVDLDMPAGKAAGVYAGILTFAAADRP